MINPIFDKETLSNLEQTLKEANNIVIISHKSPDGDAVGSSIALQQYLEKKGLVSSVILPDKAPSFLNWMNGIDDIIIFDKQRKEVIDKLYHADVIFTLDFNDQLRVGNDMGKYLINSPAIKIMIDHHQAPKDYANYMFSDVKSCSTAQLIYEYIEANDDIELIDIPIAESIYTGIVTDSGSFRFSSTTPKTHEIASKLLEKGLDQSLIHESIYDVNTQDRLNLLGYTLNEKLEILEGGTVAIISLTRDEMLKFNTQKGYTEGFVNYALSILGVQIGIFVKEDEHLVKLSFRSKRDIPVNEFAKTFFEGGGHINAAGGRSDLSVLETIDKIKNHIGIFVKDNV